MMSNKIKMSTKRIPDTRDISLDDVSKYTAEQWLKKKWHLQTYNFAPHTQQCQMKQEEKQGEEDGEQLKHMQVHKKSTVVQVLA